MTAPVWLLTAAAAAVLVAFGQYGRHLRLSQPEPGPREARRARQARWRAVAALVVAVGCAAGAVLTELS